MKPSRTYGDLSSLVDAKKCPYDLSVVVPVFNEEPENLLALVSRLESVLSSDKSLRYELIFVDDGSEPNVRAYLQHLESSYHFIKAVFLSRNFGEQAAIMAGLRYSSGSAVVNMDSDLQDPPELIPQMLAYFREGYEVIYSRQARRREPITKTLPAFLFYRLLNSVADCRITPDVGEFRLLARCVVDALCALPEKTYFLRGLVPWMGFSSKEIPFERQGRSLGQTSYTLDKLIRLAVDALVSFSSAPLRLITWLGVLTFSLFFIFAVFCIFNSSIFSQPIFVPMMALSILFVACLQMLCMGIMAVYQIYLVREVRDRPHFIVSKLFGFNKTQYKSFTSDLSQQESLSREIEIEASN